MLEVVQFVPVPLLLPFLVDCQKSWRVFPALVVLGGFARDGSFLKLYSLEVQGSVSLPLLRFVELWDPFLWRYHLLRPKFLHEAQEEPEGAIVGSSHVVRCRS